MPSVALALLAAAMLAAPASPTTPGSNEAARLSKPAMPVPKKIERRTKGKRLAIAQSKTGRSVTQEQLGTTIVLSALQRKIDEHTFLRLARASLPQPDTAFSILHNDDGTIYNVELRLRSQEKRRYLVDCQAYPAPEFEVAVFHMDAGDSSYQSAEELSRGTSKTEGGWLSFVVRPPAGRDIAIYLKAMRKGDWTFMGCEITPMMID